MYIARMLYIPVCVCTFVAAFFLLLVMITMPGVLCCVRVEGWQQPQLQLWRNPRRTKVNVHDGRTYHHKTLDGLWEGRILAVHARMLACHDRNPVIVERDVHNVVNAGLSF